MAAGKSTARKDFLRELEIAAQKEWEAAKCFESDAGEQLEGRNKYFTTFPYPYMNGLLHLGHTFSLSKVEFAVGYERLQGKHTLWPFAFHCTGMPIQAAANKLKREIETYGNPPDFTKMFEELAAKDNAAAPAPEASKDPSVHHSKKSKAAAKKGAATQWDILVGSEVNPDEIPKFVDPHYWLQYFPPLAKDHLKLMGVKVDWRRSFITTAVNPYYDSFIKWQFNKLRALNKLQFGKRYSVYSPLDGQLCADHDRSVGEGVVPQEYTLILMDLIEPLPEKLTSLTGKRVSLAAATLRPETMYGQTNCWILPDGDYGVYELAGGNYIVTADRAAKNMAFQDMTGEWSKTNCVARCKGTDIIGAALKAPLCPFEKVYCLPMMTISLVKGTGVVTSVPSDSPDDYMALKDLKSKPALRDKYGVTEAMVDFEPVRIIDIPELGDFAAPTLCEQMKIKSQNDRDLLAQAKEKVYLKGFYDGVIIVGDHKGKKVADAKPLVRQQLIDQGFALAYAEPEKYVESRSGDECVVALTDQWYISYGEEEWLAAVQEHLKNNVECYSDETKKLFLGTLGWLKEWGCSRSFGLGTLLPWDEQYLIESLSDSTIYMAFYTVAHYLQGNFDGSEMGTAKIEASKVTDAVWEHIMLDGPVPADSGIPAETLARMKHEFNYWYPVDLRASGKDLIQNHLTFFLYNHAAIFPKHQWPQAIRTNGHVLLNNDKMSKSSGNFLTLEASINKFGADAMRMALAQAGDSNEDANFEEEVANKAVLRLYTEIKWVEEVVELIKAGRLYSGELGVFDKIFEAEISKCIIDCKDGFQRHVFRDAINAGFFLLQNARDAYRAACVEQGRPGQSDVKNPAERLHAGLVSRFVEVQALLLSPMCPHVSEHLWKLLGKEGLIVNARFPEVTIPDPIELRKSGYCSSTLHEFRKKRIDFAAKLNKPAKGKSAAPPPQGPVKFCAQIVTATAFLPWQQTVLKAMSDNLEDGQLPKDIKKRVMAIDEIKKNSKQCMPFVGFVEADFRARGAEALDTSLPFTEFDFLTEAREYISAHLEVSQLEIFRKDSPEAQALGARAEAAVPGNPVVMFTAVAAE